MTRFERWFRSRGWHRDPEHGLILGVCAGIGEALGWPAWLVRIGLLALAWFHPVATILAYLIVALVLRERPLQWHGDGDERAFWRAHRDGSGT